MHTLRGRSRKVEHKKKEQANRMIGACAHYFLRTHVRMDQHSDDRALQSKATA